MARNAQQLIDMAAAILSKPQGAGVKNLLYTSGCPPNLMPMLTSVVTGTLWSTDMLLACAEEDGLLALEPSALPAGCPPLNPPPQELIVVLYEALLGSRRVRGTSPIVQLVQSRKDSLQRTLAARRRRGATNYVTRVRLPRFLRINALKTTVEEAKAHIASLGFCFVEPERGSDSSNNLAPAPKTFMLDPILPGVFVLPPGTSLHEDGEVARGALVLQDRSSCLSAIALSPPPGAVCIDTCASPGNKTLHLASIMAGQGDVDGRITAFERDPARLATLQRRISEQGGYFVDTRGGDFMKADLSADGEFAEVTHVLIDPTCSGSGVIAAYEAGASRASEYDRGSAEAGSGEVAALARAQLQLILHAMKLPAVRTVVYSTCSVFREENEDVVRAVLAAQSDFESVMAIPAWPHRGLDGVAELAAVAPLVCRATYEKDSTNGFFVARFERKSLRASERANEQAARGSALGEAATADAGSAETPSIRQKRRREAEAAGEASAQTDEVAEGKKKKKAKRDEKASGKARAAERAAAERAAERAEQAAHGAAVKAAEAAKLARKKARKAAKAALAADEAAKAAADAVKEESALAKAAKVARKAAMQL